MKFCFTTILILAGIVSAAQPVTYPAEVNYLAFTIERKPVKMAFMDVKPTAPNGRVVVLLHGKNFNGYYWKDVISFLAGKGFRVIVPDQIGWGRSSKPDIHYSFHVLAANTKKLLDTLGISRVTVIGHSMGGMLAVRFVLMYPDMADKLILEDPIGLEDYKTFVPYQSTEKLFDGELKATYESYKKYQQSYYPVWKPDYEQYVQAQAESLNDPDFPATAFANALTYQMIYEQPVVYELKNIRIPTLLIIGLSDRTVVGKELLTDAAKQQHGNYPVLGKLAREQIAGSELKELPGVGHIPHVQDLADYRLAVLSFLK